MCLQSSSPLPQRSPPPYHQGPRPDPCPKKDRVISTPLYTEIQGPFLKLNKYNKGINNYDLQVLVMAHRTGIPAVGCLWSHPSCSLAQEAVPGCCSEQLQRSSLAQRLSPALLCSLPGRVKRAMYLLLTWHLHKSRRIYPRP